MLPFFVNLSPATPFTKVDLDDEEYPTPYCTTKLVNQQGDFVIAWRCLFTNPKPWVLYSIWTRRRSAISVSHRSLKWGWFPWFKFGMTPVKAAWFHFIGESPSLFPWFVNVEKELSWGPSLSKLRWVNAHWRSLLPRRRLAIPDSCRRFAVSLGLVGLTSVGASEPMSDVLIFS